MSDAVVDFGKQILDRWKPSHAWDAQRLSAWGADLIDMLGNEKKEVLDYALRLMIGERSYTSTPLVADVVKVVNRAVKEIAAKRRSETLNLGSDANEVVSRPGQRAWSAEGVRFAYDNVSKRELAKKAAKEGWLYGLWTFWIEHRRDPTDFEINQPAYRDEKNHTRGGLKAMALTYDDLRKFEADRSQSGRAAYSFCLKRLSDAQRLSDIAHGQDVPSPAEYMLQSIGGITARVKSSPDARYADENDEEGRGWKGVTA